MLLVAMMELTLLAPMKEQRMDKLMSPVVI